MTSRTRSVASLRRVSLALAPLLAVSLGVIVVTAPPAAAAVSHFVNGNNLDIYGNAANDNISVSCVGGQVQYEPGAVQPGVTCAALADLWVDPGGGEDTVDLSAITRAAFPSLSRVTVYTEDFQPDTVTGSQIDDYITADHLDTVHGGAGDDTIVGAGGSVLTGGSGDDLIVRSNPDVLLGGPGDDRFVSSIGQISTDGGPGFDHLEYDLDNAGAVPSNLVGLIDLTLTDAHLLLTVPGAAPGVLPITGVERQYWTLLRGGEQRFNAKAYSGSVNLRGLSGKDTLIGAKGSDILRGGQGPDVIDARDGGFDVVDCGPGVDVAYVDPVDRVIDCETVIYPRPNTSKIKGPKKIRQGAKGTYRFSSSMAGSVFQCKVDKKKWKKCSSPHTVATGKLKPGKHVLRVRAGYGANNWDRSPSRKAFKVVR